MFVMAASSSTVLSQVALRNACSVLQPSAAADVLIALRTTIHLGTKITEQMLL